MSELGKLAVNDQIVNILGFVSHNGLLKSTAMAWSHHRKYVMEWAWLCSSDTLKILENSDSGPS